VPEEEKHVQKFIRKALRMRDRYMREAHQSFPATTRRFIHQTKQLNLTPETGESTNCHCFQFIPKVRMYSSPQRRPFQLALSPMRSLSNSKGIEGLQWTQSDRSNSNSDLRTIPA